MTTLVAKTRGVSCTVYKHGNRYVIYAPKCPNTGCVKILEEFMGMYLIMRSIYPQISQEVYTADVITSHAYARTVYIAVLVIKHHNYINI